MIWREDWKDIEGYKEGSKIQRKVNIRVYKRENYKKDNIIELENTQKENSPINVAIIGLKPQRNYLSGL